MSSVQSSSVRGFLKKRKSQFRFDLGFGALIHQWAKFFQTKHLRQDLVAGATVACVAVPLSLAIALASGVRPEVGLVTAIVAGIICALFGGTPLAVSGPAAAMAVLIADTVQRFGLGGLLAVGIGCGILQILTGVFGLGQIIRFVPVPVIAGFTAGIGAIIFIGQLPRALALPPPDQSHVLDVITHIRDLFHQSHPTALALALLTMAITFTLPRFLPRLPAPLIAVIIPTAIVALFGIQVQSIGTIPGSLPLPRFPSWPSGDMSDLLTTVFVVYTLASLETLLSSSAVDKLSKGERHDPDQEMIGQGLGNIASSFFGGIPVTGVIARSALNVHSGARTRRASVFHALLLLATVYFFSPILSRIPVAVLAGTLLSVALRMLHPREFIQVWKTSRVEAGVYAITFFTIVFADLIAGVQTGVIAALVIAAVRLGKTQVTLHDSEAGQLSLVQFDGPLTFLSSSKVETLRKQLTPDKLQKGVLFDMSQVTAIDATGAEQFIQLIENLILKKVKVAIEGLQPACRDVLLTHAHDHRVSRLILRGDGESAMEEGLGVRSLDRLIHGVQKFQGELQQGYDSLFKKLADGQSPHTFFVACCDSRVNPNLITSTHPGELFILRNIGNIIAPFGSDGLPAEGAAVEYAVGVLGVKHIIVCGHSGCGAMGEIISETLLSPEKAKQLPSIAQWLAQSRYLKKKLPPKATPEQASELNAILQLDHLRTYPIIREKIAEGKLKIHAWYYDIGASKLEQWDEKRNVYVEIGSKASRSLERRVEAGVQYQVPLHIPKRDKD